MSSILNTYLGLPFLLFTLKLEFLSQILVISFRKLKNAAAIIHFTAGHFTFLFRFL